MSLYAIVNYNISTIYEEISNINNGIVNKFEDIDLLENTKNKVWITFYRNNKILLKITEDGLTYKKTLKQWWIFV